MSRLQRKLKRLYGRGISSGSLVSMVMGSRGGNEGQRLIICLVI